MKKDDFYFRIKYFLENISNDANWRVYREYDLGNTCPRYEWIGQDNIRDDANDLLNEFFDE